MIADLPTLPESYRLLRYDTVASTNDEAKRLAHQGAASGTVIWAIAQTAGRGRRGRTWVSPPGNLYASLVMRPDCPVARAAQLGFVAALALGDGLDPLVPPGLKLRFKWPNDLLADGKKLAGILLESETTAGDIADFVVIGVGVNLASSPRDVEYAATSLAEEGIAGVLPQTVLAGFARNFERWIGIWRRDGFAPVRAAWLARANGLGEAVRVRLDRATFHGRFIDLDDAGALLLESAAGQRRITAGEIFPAAG